MAKNPSKDFHKFKDALRYALANYEDKEIKRGRALIHLANNLIRMAMSSDDKDALMALKELNDRLDGKPMQAITGHDGTPLTVVKRVIVQQSTPIEKQSQPLIIEHQEEKTIN